MAAASYLDYDAAAHTYRLPEEHAYLLASEDTDHFMGDSSTLPQFCSASRRKLPMRFAQAAGCGSRISGLNVLPPST